MKKSIVRNLFIASLLFFSYHAVQAQGQDKILFSGLDLGVGVGTYNAIGLGLEVPRFRFQIPLASNFTLMGSTGLSLGFLKSRYKEYYRYYYDKTTTLAIPLTVGPRFYIINGFYTGLNLGVEIGLNDLTATSFLFNPNSGYVLPLSNGDYIDLGVGFATSFSSGSGFFNFTFAYGLNFDK